MPTNYELSHRNIPLCTAKMLATVIEHIENANTLWRRGKYNEAQIDITKLARLYTRLDSTKDPVERKNIIDRIENVKNGIYD